MGGAEGPNNKQCISSCINNAYLGVYLAIFTRFVGLATLTISEGVTSALSTVCEILADTPDGISANIKVEVFKEIYTYLSER